MPGMRKFLMQQSTVEWLREEMGRSPAVVWLAHWMNTTEKTIYDRLKTGFTLPECHYLADRVLKADEATLDRIKEATDGLGCEATIDCSGNTHGRQLAIRGTRQWGRCAFVGEGGTVEFNPSPDIIHDQITLYGSWVTSLGNMEDLVERMVRWNMHPEHTATHKFPLSKADEAYAVMNEGKCGKVAVVWED